MSVGRMDRRLCVAAKPITVVINSVIGTAAHTPFRPRVKPRKTIIGSKMMYPRKSDNENEVLAASIAVRKRIKSRLMAVKVVLLK